MKLSIEQEEHIAKITLEIPILGKATIDQTNRILDFLIKETVPSLTLEWIKKEEEKEE